MSARQGTQSWACRCSCPHTLRHAHRRGVARAPGRTQRPSVRVHGTTTPRALWARRGRVARTRAREAVAHISWQAAATAEAARGVGIARHRRRHLPGSGGRARRPAPSSGGEQKSGLRLPPPKRPTAAARKNKKSHVRGTQGKVGRVSHLGSREREAKVGHGGLVTGRVAVPPDAERELFGGQHAAPVAPRSRSAAASFRASSPPPLPRGGPRASAARPCRCSSAGWR